MTDTFWTMTKWAAGGLLGALSGLLMDMPVAFWGLLIFMAADYATGVLAAIYTRTLDSNIGWRGLVKKAIIIIVVLAIWGGAKMAGLSNIPAAELVAGAFALNEFLSMIENARRAGVQIPPILGDAFAKLNGRGDQEERLLELKEEG
ncbi:MAG: phage holin family protein [Dehalococcoidia bacterium]